MVPLALAATLAAVTPAEVSRLPPDRLGALLRALPPPAIVEAYLYNDALPAPPAPGEPTVTRVMLYAAAHDGGEPDICEKTRYLLTLRPVMRRADGSVPPAAPAAVTPATLYRLRTTDGSGPACEGRGGEFLSVGDGDRPAVFAVLRRVRRLQRALAAGAPVAVAGSVADELGRPGGTGDERPVADWRDALLRFPVTRVFSCRLGGEEGEAASLRAGAWLLTITPGSGDAISRVALRRFVPSPP